MCPFEFGAFVKKPSMDEAFRTSADLTHCILGEGSDTDESVDNLTLALTPIQRGGRRSKAWGHFETELVDVDGVLKGVCKYCQFKMQTKSGTSSLISHIVVSCPAIPDDVRKSFVSTMRKQPSNEDFVFDPQLSREKMVNFCIHAEIPFLKFEDPHFQPWMDSLQPNFKCIGRHTIRSDAMKKYKAMKLELQAELANLDSRVCITTDMWTSSQNLGYMAVTAHYIDAGFNYKKKTISFKAVKYPHTGYAPSKYGHHCALHHPLSMVFEFVNISNTISTRNSYERSKWRQEGKHPRNGHNQLVDQTTNLMQ